MSLGTDLDDAATGAVGIPDTLATIDRSASREVGARNHFQQLFKTDFRIPDNRDNAVDDLAQIMWRYVGRHTNSNPG